MESNLSAPLLGCPERGPAPGTPRWDPDLLGVGVDSVDLGVPWGRALKVSEKAGRVGLDFIRTRPEAGPLRFGGLGRSGLTL